MTRIQRVENRGLNRVACPRLPNTGANSSVFIVRSSTRHAKLLPLASDKYPYAHKKTPPTIANYFWKQDNYLKPTRGNPRKGIIYANMLNKHDYEQWRLSRNQTWDWVMNSLSHKEQNCFCSAVSSYSCFDKTFRDFHPTATFPLTAFLAPVGEDQIDKAVVFKAFHLFWVRQKSPFCHYLHPKTSVLGVYWDYKGSPWAKLWC